MGTNYYLRRNRCPRCKRYDEHHIGKQSAGWKFLFNIENKIGATSVEDWKLLTQGAGITTTGPLIVDEYGYSITSIKFWDMVEEKQTLKSAVETDDKAVDIDGYDFKDGEFC